MVILDQIRRLVERLAPAPICDACIADRLNIALSDDLRARIGELAGDHGFHRARDTYALCDASGPVLYKSI